MARRIVPGIALSTDIIVGFPGETEPDFEATLSLLEDVRFDDPTWPRRAWSERSSCSVGSSWR
jgi:tRNA A37 methylthiotransferase MiaB